MAVENARFQQRGATEAQLLAVNETPMERELVVASDSGRAWVGDGFTSLSGLKPLLVADPVTGTLSKSDVTALAETVAQEWAADA